MDNFDLKKYLAEGKLLKEEELTPLDTDRLNSLYNELESSLNPNNKNYNGRNVDDIRKDIRNEFGEEIAKTEYNALLSYFQLDPFYYR